MKASATGAVNELALLCARDARAKAWRSGVGHCLADDGSHRLVRLDPEDSSKDLLRGEGLLVNIFGKQYTHPPAKIIPRAQEMHDRHTGMSAGCLS